MKRNNIIFIIILLLLIAVIIGNLTLKKYASNIAIKKIVLVDSDTNEIIVDISKNMQIDLSQLEDKKIYPI